MSRLLIPAWRNDYTHYRPHPSLDGLTRREGTSKNCRDDAAIVG